MAPTDVTLLIHRVHGGDAAAREDLWTLVYEELRRLASRHMSRERGTHTLQPTALVHEAWLRLRGEGSDDWDGRAHFFGVAAEAMRRILVEHARKRHTLRRGGGLQRVDEWDALVEALAEDGDLAGDLEALDRALTQMESSPRHARKAEVVKLRFFVGLTNEQCAEVLGTSRSSVKRDWDFAKAWLSRSLLTEPAPEPAPEAAPGPRTGADPDQEASA